MTKKSNLLLIRPSSSQGKLTKTAMSQHPINLLYLLAYARKQGHNVKMLDLEVEDLNPQDIIKFKPDVVGISAMTPLVYKASEVAKKIKSFLKNEAVFVIGGNHVSALPERTLEEFPIFDIGVVGEGEETLKEICDGKKPRDILGIVYRDNVKIKVNKPRQPIENLDSLPFPARDLIDMRKYKGASTPGFSRDFLKITELYINRGCNWGLCTFCASMNVHCKFRMRSIDNVMKEIEECIDKYGINHFTVDDDTLTTSKERTLEFCRKIKKYKVGWDCDSRATIDKEVIQAMKDAGCKKIAFGVESGSQRILSKIKKGISINQIKNVFRYSKEVGIDTTAFFIVGAHPDETLEDIESTKRLIAEIEPDYLNVSVVVPYPGTELRGQMKELGLVYSDDWRLYAIFDTIPRWRTTHFSSEELIKIQKGILKSFYLRPGYIFKRILKIRRIKEIKYWVKAFLGFAGTFLK